MFAILLCGAFLTPVDYFIVNVALPSIRAGLNADSATLQLVISGYAATHAVMLITGGRLGDLFGRVRMSSQFRIHHEWLIVPRGKGSLVITEEAQKGAGAVQFRLDQPNAMHDGHDWWLSALKVRSERMARR